MTNIISFLLLALLIDSLLHSKPAEKVPGAEVRK